MNFQLQINKMIKTSQLMTKTQLYRTFFLFHFPVSQIKEFQSKTTFVKKHRKHENLKFHLTHSWSFEQYNLSFHMWEIFLLLSNKTDKTALEVSTEKCNKKFLHDDFFQFFMTNDS